MGFFPAQTDAYGNLKTVTAENQLDGFQRVRTAAPEMLWSVKQDILAQDYLFNTLTATGGTITYDAARASTALAVTSSSGSTAVRQSRAYIPYQSAKATTVVMTGIMGAAQTNTVKRIGFFDDNNGLFFEQDGSTKRVVVRSNVSGSPVDTQVNQSSWNVDKLDGTGQSGITIDWTKAQIFTIDFQWLGVGVIRFGFNINGILVICHEVYNANVATSVFMRTPNLPVRYSIHNSAAAAGASDLEMICAAVICSGGFDDVGKPFTATTGVAGKSVGTTLVPLISLRAKSTTPHPIAQLSSVSIINPGNRDLFWAAYVNPTLTGAAFADVASMSQLQADITASAITGGFPVRSGFISAGGSLANTFEQNDYTILSSNYDASVQDIITLAAAQVSGASNTVYASINWLEYV